MTMISIEDPNLQRAFRKFAADAVAFLDSIDALAKHDQCPEPGTQEKVRAQNQDEGILVELVSEWRTNDLTRHVRIFELESDELILDAVYAEGGNEELEQLLVENMWLVAIIERSQASTLRPLPVDAS